MAIKGFVRSEFKQDAKEKLSGNWVVSVAITVFFLIVLGIYSVASMMYKTQMEHLDASADFMTTFQAMQGVLSVTLVIFLIGGALSCTFQLAASKFFLNLVKRSPEVGMGDFLGYFRYILKAIGAGLWQMLWISLWQTLFMLPALVAFAAGVGLLTSSAMTGEFKPIAIVAIGIAIVLYILGIVVGIIKSISYSQMYFVLADEDSIGVLRSMRISKLLTKNYLGDIFVLYLSFILWHLFGLITAGIGYFYVYPYMMSTFAEAYLFLRNQAFEEESLAPEEFGLRRVCALETSQEVVSPENLPDQKQEAIVAQGDGDSGVADSIIHESDEKHE